MARTAFGALLSEMIDNSRLTKPAIEADIKEKYKTTTVTVGELNKYMAGKVIPGLEKFAALVDVLGLSQGEITRLIRTFPRRQQEPGR